MLDDDATLDGDYPPPAAYHRLWEATGQLITVRVTGARIPTLPRLAFGQEFQRLSDIYGQRYLELRDLTGHDAYRSGPTPQRRVFERLSDAYPDTFTTVVDRRGPYRVWLALPLAALTDVVADAILAAHHALPVPRRPGDRSTGEDIDA